MGDLELLSSQNSGHLRFGGGLGLHVRYRHSTGLLAPMRSPGAVLRGGLPGGSDEAE